ncbi:cysteine-rich RLK (RECEPTOR-like protein kinase) 8 [Hibiscus trionum]|uniref:Cysteine-rich RLK (RECEPTOR-like protein kinase) 8 n=1 Tax=Hibiscus trionum TaxID=183268 RepID=A0A9W7H914_HIBTR|nr:cysteine-rich RLK (RECEPTOR-like protein kinase) 8 [Hibiscus trionum]
MERANSTPTPMVASQKLAVEGAGKPLSDAREYRSIVGMLLYACHTRPDITYSVNRVAQFMHALCELHMVAVKKILRYLVGTQDLGLIFTRSSSSPQVVAFSDADWGSSTVDRRSISGHCVFVGNGLVTWNSSKQKVVSRSTMEAEYRSLADSAAEVIWINALLKEIGIKLEQVPTIWCDNKSAIALTANPVYHARSKHVDLDIHFVREKVALNQICVNYIPTTHQIADGFTKPLTRVMFEAFRNKVCVKKLEEAGGMLNEGMHA